MKSFLFFYFFIVWIKLYSNDFPFENQFNNFVYYNHSDEKSIWFSNTHGWINYNGKEVKTHLFFNSNIKFEGKWIQSDLFEGIDNELWTCTYEYLCRYTSDVGFDCFQPVFQGDTINTKIKAIHFFKDKSELLFRFKERLLVLNTKTNNIKDFEIPSSNGQVIVPFSKDENICFASSPWTGNPEMELWELSKGNWNKSKFDFSTCISNLKNILISDFYFDGISHWLATNKGLVKLNENNCCISELFEFKNEKSNLNKLEYYKDHLLVSTDFKGLLIFDLKHNKFIKSINSNHSFLELNSDMPFEIFNFGDTFYISFSDGSTLQKIYKTKILSEFLLGQELLIKHKVNLVTSNGKYIILSDRERFIKIFNNDFELIKTIKLETTSILGDFEISENSFNYTQDHKLLEFSFDDLEQSILFEDQSTKINFLTTDPDFVYVIGVSDVRRVETGKAYSIDNKKVLPTVARFIKICDTYISSSTTSVKLANTNSNKVIELGSYISLLEKGRGEQEALILSDGNLSLLNIETQELESLYFENTKFDNIIVKNENELIAWGEDGAYSIDKNNSIQKIIHTKNIKSLTYFNDYYIYSAGKNEMHALHKDDIIQSGIDSLSIYTSTYPYELNEDIYEISYRYFEEPLTLDFSASSVIGNENNYYSITYDDAKLGKEFLTYREAITFNRFPNGKNRFTVQGYNQDGTLSNQLKFSVNVRGPIYQQWWFYVIFGGILISGIILYYRTREKRLKDKHALTQEIAQLQKSALQAQMNPHFIFNCLNSIQSFIMKNEKENAMDYLGQFAQLIRGNLNASLSRTISLEDEIRILEDYLSLEQLRLDHCFEYLIEVSPGLTNKDVFFPPMLIQPFVENAVIHGMRNKTNNGVIIVEFIPDINDMLVIVKDNGPGNKATSISSHKSVGVEITSKRLAHLNNTNDDNVNIDIQQSSEGTTVKLKVKYTNSRSDI